MLPRMGENIPDFWPLGESAKLRKRKPTVQGCVHP